MTVWVLALVELKHIVHCLGDFVHEYFAHVEVITIQHFLLSLTLNYQYAGLQQQALGVGALLLVQRNKQMKQTR